LKLTKPSIMELRSLTPVLDRQYVERRRRRVALWRRQALTELPELKSLVEASPSVMALWIELEPRLAAAYRAQPADEETIRCIYRLALSTLRNSPDPEAMTAVLVAFFEHLPTRPEVRADIHRWIEPSVFQELESAFGYFLAPDEVAALRREYHARRDAWLS
jgi:hypothetical protein